MITSPDNQQLKMVRKLQDKRHRQRTGLFLAEGEDLVRAAEDAGCEPQALLVAGVDVEPALLASASGLGSGTRVIGVYRQHWSEPGGEASLYLHGVRDPGNVGAALRCAHALADGPVVLGPGCADPFAPKAVRASMGSIFARPPARAPYEALRGFTLALDTRAERELAGLRPPAGEPVVVCLGSERQGLPSTILERTSARARIPVRDDGPESLNVAIAAAIALYQLARPANRMADRA